ncbi:MAG: ATP-grasp domain-containing protein [Candidatus Pacebacteria bacterium]|nr:ATP-grasp domain-containing protein [Candidatus Paceibacterota bacterium]
MIGEMFEKIAPRIGATIVLEPEWGVVGQIIFKKGRRSYFRYNTLDLNPMGSSEIAKDKDYANFFMKSMGYPIVPGSKTFFSDRWSKIIRKPSRNIDGAYHYARKIEFPVIVKPNSGSQGSGVTLVHNKREFYKAMHAIFKGDRVALVQKPVYGKDYRIVVLDNKIISVYERIPLSVIGNGKSTIKKLLKEKQLQFIASSRDTHIKTNDPRITMKLKHRGLTLRYVPAKGEKIYLLDNANLSTRGDSLDVTKKIHPDFKALAIKLTHDMGLRLCGVDFMIDGDISQKPGNYWVLEINSAPGLDHYAKMGKAQEDIVENLYLKVLKHMEG